ncbi:GNAT family N-acetyltransferase [Marinospirillum insulare]|uniref:N-acetyltransferase domain-containing protein n=1 Tax=Marinospirillum insulare TaxID=217169 RepID=A0ABQ5ZX33_9GAMM|nr:GNAT family N-acetyltransferase [Marinospirillum insulare]GLR63567.1 hypothetical protein GCM10007878_10020 [Marinospirillum insulare]
MNLETTIKKPADCNQEELADFERLINEGGEVTAVGLRGRILQAEKLVLINQAGKCVAIGAIKNPNPGYKVGVFNKAGVAASQQYKFELGWLYVPEEERGKGNGRELMRVITESLIGQKSYATTRENNQVMHKLFEAFGYTKAGKSYPSQNGDYLLALYTSG